MPVTRANRVLRAHAVRYTEHEYAYEPGGGTTNAASALGVDEHAVIKTLIMEDDRSRPMIVLMHGDREVSTGNLARALGARDIMPCDPAVADRYSGYQVGGTSPFGTRKAMPVYMERSIGELPYVYVNGGRKGYLVGMAPIDLIRVLQPVSVEVATVK